MFLNAFKLALLRISNGCSFHCFAPVIVKEFSDILVFWFYDVKKLYNVILKDLYKHIIAILLLFMESFIVDR